MSRNKLFLLMTIIFAQVSFALEPDQILVIANSDIPESMRIAQYYCRKRAVPTDNLITLSLGKNPVNSISRKDYDTKIVEPLIKTLKNKKFEGKIKCLLTIYGIPLSVGGRGKLEGNEEQLKQIKELIAQGKEKLEKLNEENKQDSAEKKQLETKNAQLQLLIDIITGKETNASVDSELSMVLFENYELYRWQINMLNESYDISEPNEQLDALRNQTLMVSRLDGPSEKIITSLVDKAISAEKTGLKGYAYFDSRGIYNENEYGKYDQNLRELAFMTKSQTDLTVKEDRSGKLFQPGTCPQTAIYCGWYSLKKYVDAFEFVDGAVGYHIASFEAVGLRDPNSTTWCPALLEHGITATLGPVAEPYLQSFPKPKDFFSDLYKGYSLAESFYRTKPFNSWMLVLIGDPLYRPFKQNNN